MILKFANLQKLPLYRKFLHIFAIKKYQWLQKNQGIGFFLGGGFCEMYCITHSKLGKSVKSVEIISSGPVILAYLC